MSSAARRQGMFVVPGDRVGVIEEFIPGQGTYVEDGEIRASSVGFLLLNLKEHKVSVFRPMRFRGAACWPKPGAVVIGEVFETHGTYALIRIWMVGPKHLPGFFTGLLHKSSVGIKVRDMFNACRPGDIVRAKVINTKNRICHLTFANKKLGVIYAFCSSCGDLLKARPDKKLICETCGSLELRKIASDYGEAVL